MSKSISATPSVSDFALPDNEQRWLESLNLSHATNVDRHGAFDLLNSDQVGIPYKRGAVFSAFNDGSIPTAFVSGRALASAHDVVRWALVRKYTSRRNSTAS